MPVHGPRSHRRSRSTSGSSSLVSRQGLIAPVLVDRGPRPVALALPLLDEVLKGRDAPLAGDRLAVAADVARHLRISVQAHQPLQVVGLPGTQEQPSGLNRCHQQTLAAPAVAERGLVTRPPAAPAPSRSDTVSAGPTPSRYVGQNPKKALASITGKVKALCRQGTNLELAVLLHRLNLVLRGWTTYFRPGVSFTTFQYLGAFTWRHVIAWLRRKHPRINWKALRRRYCGGGWWPADGDTVLFNPVKAGTTRYRYRGTAIPSPWPTPD